jgi:hypothetical protein
MEATCRFCGAKDCLAERVAGPASSPIFSHCCHGGKVILDPLPAPLSPVRSLLADQTTQGRLFGRHSAVQLPLCFHPFPASEVDAVVNSRGPWTWKQTTKYITLQEHFFLLLSNNRRMRNFIGKDVTRTFVKN